MENQYFSKATHISRNHYDDEGTKFCSQFFHPIVRSAHQIRQNIGLIMPLILQLQPNPRKLMPGPPSGLTDNDGTIDPKNFATIRTTSIVQREQKEHLQEDMHDQMSGYKRLRR